MLTQSISDVLDVIEATATARTAVLASAGITTAQLGVGLPGLASIYTGYVQIPYFGDPANPLTSFWVNAQPHAADRREPTFRSRACRNNAFRCSRRCRTRRAAEHSRRPAGRS